MYSELFADQGEALQALRQTVGQGVSRIVMAAPTGWGKTKLAAAVVDGALRKERRVAFVVDAIDLIDQTLQNFAAEGITDVGVIQRDHQLTDWSKPVQVCSIQTLAKRGTYPQANVVLFDECHVLHRQHKAWLKDPAFAQVPFIGLSATPWSRGLGKYFDSLIVVATTQELIERGRLSAFRVFATGHPDLRDVDLTAGDFNEAQLSKAMQRGGLTADIIRTWKMHWDKDKTLVFAVDRDHARALQQRFVEAGVSAGYQDARTDDHERREIRRAFHAGELRVVVNIGTLTKGIDWDVRCIVLARPTRSEILFVQIIGRGLRTAEGKPDCLILDHSDTHQRLGFVTDIHHDELNDGRIKLKAPAKPPLPKECPKCTALVKTGILKCPNCGFEFKPQVSSLLEREGELIEICRHVIPKQVRNKREYAWTWEERLWFFGQLRGYVEENGFKPGWADHAYHERFGGWPREDKVSGVPALPCGMYVRVWLKQRKLGWIAQKYGPRKWR
jgi:superfamily II DNA or RNA helicase